MDLEKDTQVEKTAPQPLSKGDVSDALPKCAVNVSKPDDLDPHIIDFEKDDSDDPQNWSSYYKWSITLLLALMSIIVLRTP